MFAVRVTHPLNLILPWQGAEPRIVPLWHISASPGAHSKRSSFLLWGTVKNVSRVGGIVKREFVHYPQCPPDDFNLDTTRFMRFAGRLYIFSQVLLEVVQVPASLNAYTTFYIGLCFVTSLKSVGPCSLFES